MNKDRIIREVLEICKEWEKDARDHLGNPPNLLLAQVFPRYVRSILLDKHPGYNEP